MEQSGVTRRSIGVHQLDDDGAWDSQISGGHAEVLHQCDETIRK
jgi:hypothetical protein